MHFPLSMAGDLPFELVVGVARQVKMPGCLIPRHCTHFWTGSQSGNRVENKSRSLAWNSIWKQHGMVAVYSPIKEGRQ